LGAPQKFSIVTAAIRARPTEWYYPFMLEFSVRGYVEISYQFGLVLAALRGSEPALHGLSKSSEKLLAEANRLGLVVTRDALGEMLLEVVKEHPGTVKVTGEGDVTGLN
jgi:hypothetical protein